MSAERWITAGIPEMLDLGVGLISSRKLDLFNIWCCQALRPYLTDRRSIAAARFAERHVDEPSEYPLDRDNVCEGAHAALVEMTAWAETANGPAEYRKRRVYVHAAHVAEQAVRDDARNRGVLANSKHTAHVFSWANDENRNRNQVILAEDDDTLLVVHLRRQAAIFREIVGDPFRPVEFDPRWRTSDVLDLARAIYDEKAFLRLPILSDALMDAGCEDETVLSHCRTPNIHVRGCWLIDLILRKE